MGRVQESFGIFNTTIRTLLMLVLVGGAGIGGYKAYEIYNEPKKQLADTEAKLAEKVKSLQQANVDLATQRKEISSLGQQVAEKTQQVERLEVAMQLLKVRKRLARLNVLDQLPVTDADAALVRSSSSVAATNQQTGINGTQTGTAPPVKNVITQIEFVEVNEQGDPIGQAKQFKILGDMVYVDYLRVTFDDKYIESSDMERSTSIALFQRLFGEHQEAAEGFQLDTVGTRPTAYGRGTDMSKFEKEIWNDFWLIANDPQKAAAKGIHAAHGNAVSMRVQPHTSYEIELRSTGDMTIRPLDVSKKPVPSNPLQAPSPSGATAPLVPVAPAPSQTAPVN